MNIYKHYTLLIEKVIKTNQKKLYLKKETAFKGHKVETPPKKYDYDISTNIAMILGKLLKVNPLDLCSKLEKILLNDIKDFKKIDIVKPGFINISLDDKAIEKFIKHVFINQEKYGSFEDNKKYNIEFVSANPTGPLHVGHCRGAIFGDVLCNLLLFNGNKVIKEYYINDYGSQINNFTKSIFLRMRELLFNEKFENNENLYPGQYIIDIAKNILKKKPNINLENYESIREKIEEEGLKFSLGLIKSDLSILKIKHDNFISEKELVGKNLVHKSVEKLKKNNFVEMGFLQKPKGEDAKNWKKREQLIFKSTKFGDDSDRSLQKADGTWTYFANDLAYHADKVNRNYDCLINILGADHTGYIKRITSAVKALSNSKTNLECKVCQLVKLYKNGEPFKMSKRAGDFITVSDLLNEIDIDIVRFMMLNRSSDVELDFDFNKVVEKNKDNPVYYVQYCFARISSLQRILKINLNNFEIKKGEILKFNDFEKKILRKIFEWPEIIKTSSKKLEPHRIPFYLYELSTLFHSYWSAGKDIKSYKFIINGKARDQNILAIVKLIYITLKNGMKILNVSLPEKM